MNRCFKPDLKTCSGLMNITTSCKNKRLFVKTCIEDTTNDAPDKACIEDKTNDAPGTKSDSFAGVVRECLNRAPIEP